MAAAAAFDVDSSIVEFMNDAARTTLELPAMAAAQRKLAKAVVDRYPELSSESYGLGADRCLHIFKPKAGNLTGSPTSSPVSVKNTFIDDWISGEGEERGEAPAFRSLPVQLPKATFEQNGQAFGKSSASLATQATPPKASAAPLVLPTKGPEKVLLSTSPARAKVGKQLDLSPIGESSPKWPKENSFLPTNTVASFASMAQPAGTAERNLPTLLSGCQVRNTFIHIDAGDDSDERSTQSMPHGMFRQCFEEEAARRSHEASMKATVSATVPSASRALEPEVFIPGMLVVIQGLTKLPAFNGKTGIIESHDAETGRYSISLTSSVPGCPRHAKVKADNLKPQATFLSVSPPPPAYIPALDANSLMGYSPIGMPEIPATPQWADDIMGTSPLRLTGLV